MLAGVAYLNEPWFPLADQPSAQAEAAQLDRLLAAVRAEASKGAARVWLSTAGGRAAESDSLGLAVLAALNCPSVRVVATGIRVPSWIRLVEDAATADGLCGGRLEIAFGELPDRDTLTRLRDAWSGAPMQLDADDRIELYPRPVHPDGPALWSEVADAADAVCAAELEIGAIVADPAIARTYAEAPGALLPRPVAVVGPVADGLPPGAVVLSRIEIG